MFRRWAETRLYRKTMQLAVAELRRAARAANPLEKLIALETAEQKLKDAQWLSPELENARFETGLAEINRSRKQTLEQALTATERLLKAADKRLGERAQMLLAASHLLSLLNHYLPEDQRVEPLNARFLKLGGKQQAYIPPPPLSGQYNRPHSAVGCGTLIILLVIILLLKLSG